MFNGKVGSLILVLLISGAFMTGCFWGKGDNSPATPAPAVINEPLPAFASKLRCLQKMPLCVPLPAMFRRCFSSCGCSIVPAAVPRL